MVCPVSGKRYQVERVLPLLALTCSDAIPDHLLPTRVLRHCIPMALPHTSPATCQYIIKVGFIMALQKYVFFLYETAGFSECVYFLFLLFLSLPRRLCDCLIFLCLFILILYVELWIICLCLVYHCKILSNFIHYGISRCAFRRLWWR